MSYAEAIQFLYGLQMFGARPGLQTTRQLAALTGNPQDKLRFIHVAGTNGKGSTCAMLESIYRAAGLRVGLFTSPHLVSFRERIQVNRELISASGVARLASDIQLSLKTFSDDQHPTMFEVVTVLALRHFAEQKCDLVIWETGLGGRLDATNIVTPLASVITNIALDHQAWLGDTLAKIAAEKAGIIKTGVPVVTTERGAEALGVVERVARENNSPLTRVESTPSTILPPSSSLSGSHQRTNSALARATVEILRETIPVSDAQIAAGLAQVKWLGRLQLITRQNGQQVLLDGAHNIAGVQTLRAALEQNFKRTDRTLILGMLGDKDWQVMCDMLAPLASRIMLVPVDSARTATPEELAVVCRAANPQAEIHCIKTLSVALESAAEDAFVVIAGSLYLIGAALALLDPEFSGSGDERGLNEWGGGQKSNSPR
ncbi:MAG: bifunctional folylpolyglutamate synthase/dihydrofolate synthase [Verrucomicrobia bacterium]|nr:MAG: bifunctional folylpolyglutamate synthase/dihydrofolate synthase [Verrucomicrobiota bacterium]